MARSKARPQRPKHDNDRRALTRDGEWGGKRPKYNQGARREQNQLQRDVYATLHDYEPHQ